MARLIEAELRSERISVTGCDIWRDSGWLIEGAIDGTPYELALAVADQTPFLQVAVHDGAGAPHRLLTSTTPEMQVLCHSVAEAALRVLTTHGCHSFHWRINGAPQVDDPSEPVALATGEER